MVNNEFQRNSKVQSAFNKSLGFQDGPTGSTSFVDIYQNVCLDP